MDASAHEAPKEKITDSGNHRHTPACYTVGTLLSEVLRPDAA